MAKEIELAPGRWVGERHPCFIIAEVGQNHQGDLDIAKTLIRAAKDSGADCVKFQKTCLHEKFNSAALERPYTGPNSWGSTYGTHKQRLEFSVSQFKELQSFALQTGIIFTASAMDMVSVDILDSLAVPFLKVGSGDANNFPLLKHAATKKDRPIVVSTGMQDMKTVRCVYDLLVAANSRFCLLHCVSAYPAPAQDINLRVIETYKEEFPGIPIGYSGHELGTAISVAAVAMGAQVLERHITLDKSWKGSDHICSLTPSEFRDLVHQVRTVESALGDPMKQFQPSEEPCYVKLGKTLVAARDLSSGHRLAAEDIKVKVAEPKGCPAEMFGEIVGKMLLKDICQDGCITLQDVCSTEHNHQ